MIAPRLKSSTSLQIASELERSTIDASRRRLARKKSDKIKCKYLILGAGCAGLSLAWHLLGRGVRDRIVLVDRREGYTNDRTWCFWDVEPTPFDHLATHAWDRWDLFEPSGRLVACSSNRYRYRRLRAIDFYEAVQNRLSAFPNVELVLGETVLQRQDTGKGFEVETTGGIFQGDLAFDSARLPEHLLSASSQPEHPFGLVQHFLGQTVRVDRPVFDPDRPILMDFRVDQSSGPRFVYLLPISAEVALVENTYLSAASISADRHRMEIRDYLREHFGQDAFEVLEEESGRIPMSTARPVRPPDSRAISIGLAGGAARPSSGYAFLRIQRQCRNLANALTAGGTLEKLDLDSLAPRKYDFFDTVFLQVLADRPERAPQLFSRMFRGAGADSLVRFLGDASGWRDDLRLILALPKLPFLPAAIRSAPNWLPRLCGQPRITRK